MTTGETVAVVAVVGVGAFLLYKAATPSVPTVRSGSVPTALTSFAGLATALTGLIGSAGAANTRGGYGSAGGWGTPPDSYSVVAPGGTFFPTVNSVDTSAQQSYAISHDATALEGNQIIDLNTGNALTYGTD